MHAPHQPPPPQAPSHQQQHVQQQAPSFPSSPAPAPALGLGPYSAPSSSPRPSPPSLDFAAASCSSSSSSFDASILFPSLGPMCDPPAIGFLSCPPTYTGAEIHYGSNQQPTTTQPIPIQTHMTSHQRTPRQDDATMLHSMQPPQHQHQPQPHPQQPVEVLLNARLQELLHESARQQQQQQQQQAQQQEPSRYFQPSVAEPLQRSLSAGSTPVLEMNALGAVQSQLEQNFQNALIYQQQQHQQQQQEEPAQPPPPQAPSHVRRSASPCSVSSFRPPGSYRASSASRSSRSSIRPPSGLSQTPTTTTRSVRAHQERQLRAAHDHDIDPGPMVNVLVELKRLGRTGHHHTTKTRHDTTRHQPTQGNNLSLSRPLCQAAVAGLVSACCVAMRCVVL